MNRSIGCRVWFVLLGCLTVAACFKGVDSKNIKCTTSDHCPDGYICSNNSCINKSSAPLAGTGGGSAGGSAGGAGPIDASSPDVPLGLDGSSGTDTHVDGPVTPACPSGQHLCGGKCVSDSDVTSCGVACSPCPVPANGGTATCDGKACGGRCPATKTLCKGACIDSSTCSDCETGTHQCNGFCVASGEVTACGTSCTNCPVPRGALRATCDGAKCGFVCDSGYHTCGNTCERDDSPAACGASCAVCPTDPNGAPACVGGVCAINCNTGYHYCSNVKKCLKDSETDSCGTSCSPCPAITDGTPTCTAGVCSGKCSGTKKLCNGACIDATAVCGGCPTGTHNCSGLCSSDTATSSCGTTSCTPCPVPEGASNVTCTAGMCDFSCNSGRHKCGTACPADDDANACGSTCKKCPTDPNGAAVCQNGTCAIRCNSGWHNCNGACVSNSALETCGISECTTACKKPVGGSVTCNGTACVPACPASAPQNCNGTCIADTAPCAGKCLNGQKYCANTDTCIPSTSTSCCSASECAAGGSNTTATCTNNTCGLTCSPASYTKCGTTCFDLNSNSSNCGTCGNQCGASTPKCSSGNCVQCTGNGDCGGSTPYCSAAGQCVQCTTASQCGTGKTCQNNLCVCSSGVDCGAAGCVNTSTNNSHCGGCNRPCSTATGMSCSGGQCACSASAPPKPVLNASASTTTACLGTTAKISVTPASGYTYKWYKTGSTIPLTDGATYTGTTTPTLSFPNVATSAGNGSYYCEITGTAACAGSTASDSFGLTINLPPTLDPTSLSDSSFTLCSGYCGMLLWVVKANSSTSFDFGFNWKLNGAPVPAGWVNSDGYDTSRLQINKSCEVAGAWQLEVTDNTNGCIARTPVSTLTVSCPSGGTCNSTSSCP